MTDVSRKVVSQHNTSTHFILGKHPTIHFSESRITSIKPDTVAFTERKSSNSLNTCGSNF